jgi:hypothetical protein
MSASELNHQDEPDRRRFFRIEDSISLSYHPVPPEDLEHRLERLETEMEDNFTAASSLASISQRMAGVLHKISVESPEIAQYLKALDQKIDLLGRAMLSNDPSLQEQQAQAVNLSASGMAFNSAQPEKVGTVLELRLILLPSLMGLLIYGEVMGCEKLKDPEQGFSHNIRVDFSHMRDSDRDVLIRHVIQRQTRMLRQRREEREAEE